MSITSGGVRCKPHVKDIGGTAIQIRTGHHKPLYTKGIKKMI